jgi:hypothetical protein
MLLRMALISAESITTAEDESSDILLISPHPADDPCRKTPLPKSLVAEAAIGSFLSPDDSDRREAAIAKRLDRIVRVLERLVGLRAR